MDELKQNTGAKKFVGINKSYKSKRFCLRIIALTYPIVGGLAISPMGWAIEHVLQLTDLFLDQPKEISFDANFLHGQKVDLTVFDHENPVAIGNCLA